MSFRAIIDSIPKHNAWCRGIHVLSTIDEKIRITITENEMILWAAHNTGSSCCQLTYDKTFFSEYEFKPHNFVFGEEGLQTFTDLHGIDHRLYSYEINAKSLNIVSKKSDNDELKEYILTIDNTTTCPDSLMNRFVVTINMESMIVKDHAPLFTPIKYMSNRIDLQYKRKFLDVYGGTMYDNHEPNRSFDPSLVALFNSIENELSHSLFHNDSSGQPNVMHKVGTELDEADEINYISCNHALIKNFIDNCNTSIVKDIKLELFEHFLTITASRNDLKNSSEILQHGIIISNTIDTNDLGPYCIYNVEEDTSEKIQKKISNEKRKSNQPTPSKTVVFTLKDFKNFINIATLWRNITTPVSQDDGNKEVGIWFCRPGQPILFQMSKQGIQAQLLLITDGSGTEINQAIDLSLTVANSIPVTTSRSTSPQRVSPSRKRPRVDPNPQSSIRLDMERGMQFNPLEVRDNRVSPLKVARTPLVKKHSPSKDGYNSSYNSPRRLFVMGDSQETARKPDLASGVIPTLSRTTSAISSTAKSPRPRVIEKEHLQREKEARSNLERSDTIVGWGRNQQAPPSIRGISRQSSMEEEEADRKRILKQEKMKYMKARRDLGKTKRKKEESVIEEEELGPTQYDHVKGLFE
ncbi:DNA damage checkpoint protein 1 [Monosporozyma servazzii]